MKLHLIFLLMDILMLLACGYLWLKNAFVHALRRLADCIEQGQKFQIQVAGERISIPATAIINIEHERGTSSEEVEFQLKWLIEKRSMPHSATIR